jgi:hypothetical protein
VDMEPPCLSAYGVILTNGAGLHQRGVHFTSGSRKRYISV